MTFQERIDVEVRERRAQRAELAILAKAIISNLGDGWTLIPERDLDNGLSDLCYSVSFDFGHFEGYQLCIAADLSGRGGKWDGKLSVSARYPSLSELSITERPRIAPDSICVSASRGAASIAKDIQRRFLPGMIAAHAEQRKRILDAATHRATCAARALRLATLAGADFSLSTLASNPGFRHVSYNTVHTYDPQSKRVCPNIAIGTGYNTLTVDGSEELMARLIGVINEYNVQEKRLRG